MSRPPYISVPVRDYLVRHQLRLVLEPRERGLWSANLEDPDKAVFLGAAETTLAEAINRVDDFIHGAGRDS